MENITKVTRYPYYEIQQDFACSKCDAVFTAYPETYLTKTWTTVAGTPPVTTYHQKRFTVCPFCNTECMTQLDRSSPF